MRQFHSIDQMRQGARERLPRFVFDYVDGGAGREAGLEANVAGLRALQLVPRVLGGCDDAVMTTDLFGRTWGAPLAVAPVGLPALTWPGADQAMAGAAAAANLPIVLSTSSSATIEQIAAIAPGRTWFQLYVGRDPTISADLVDRAEAAGIEVLVLTVDVPVIGRRVRDLNNNFSLAFKPGVRGIADLVMHPRWSLTTLLAGRPRFANLEPYSTDKSGDAAFSNVVQGKLPEGLKFDWEYLGALRRRWKRTLLIKGVLDPADAVTAVAMGVDGVIVSNHGGRQLDSAPASIAMLPRIREVVGDRGAVLFDSGVRAGEDITKAVALGADMVLAGRAFLYGLAAMGAAGPARTIRILLDEFEVSLPQLGCRSPADLGPRHVRNPDAR